MSITNTKIKLEDKILILRLKNNINKPHIKWDENVIDNEFLKKKKMNCCLNCKKKCFIIKEN